MDNKLECLLIKTYIQHVIHGFNIYCNYTQSSKFGNWKTEESTVSLHNTVNAVRCQLIPTKRYNLSSRTNPLSNVAETLRTCFSYNNKALLKLMNCLRSRMWQCIHCHCQVVYNRKLQVLKLILQLQPYQYRGNANGQFQTSSAVIMSWNQRDFCQTSPQRNPGWWLYTAQEQYIETEHLVPETFKYTACSIYITLHRIKNKIYVQIHTHIHTFTCTLLQIVN